MDFLLAQTLGPGLEQSLTMYLMLIVFYAVYWMNSLPPKDMSTLTQGL